MSIKIEREQIKIAIESSTSMAEAATKLKLHFATFKRYATKFELYTPNQGGEGKTKPRKDGYGKIPLQEILDGKHPQYQTFKLKQRLFQLGLKTNKCEKCGLDEWNGETIQCELDHVDGNRTNHKFSNLRILCPNCHSQTDTFRSKIRNLAVV